MKIKSRITLMLGISVLALSVSGCQKNTVDEEEDAVEAQTDDEETVGTRTDETGTETAETRTDEEDAAEAQEASAPENAEQERMELSRDTFYEAASKWHDLPDEDINVMFQKVRDSGILDMENRYLTGAAINDYDANGITDMIVCLYEEKEDAEPYSDGCLYLFMNDDTPYYIYDDFCCYCFGAIFGDFGADIDNDGNTEIVFCVQGTGCGGAGDCQKFVLKYRDGRIERMELPNDFIDDAYDCGLTVQIEKDTQKGSYSAYCPYLDDTIVFDAEENEEDWDGGNCRGYFLLDTMEYDGRQLLVGYEYLYAGYIANGAGTAVFVFDWDENGKAYVRNWKIQTGNE